MLFQLHIPKTGGTTLYFALAEAVWPGRAHVAVSEEELIDRTTGYELLGGHFTWDKLALFPERPRVVTVLRDPIELALSAYGYFRANVNEGVFGSVAQAAADEAASRSLEDLLNDPASQMRAHFGSMTFFLAGVDEVQAGRGREAALEHLNSCAWVGTTETLDRDMAVLPAMLGVGPIAEATRRMVTPDRPKRHEISAGALRLLEELTAMDRVLYDRARAIADEQQRQFA